MRSLAFAKRNLKEILRDPLSLVFCFAFPVVLMVIMLLIINSTVPDISVVPQFKIENMFGSMCVFSFTFLMLFTAMLISKDRNSSFQSRLNVSPMKSYEILFGYVLAILPLAFVQVALIFCTSLCFGLSVQWNILLAILSLVPSMLLFIGFGILLGSLFNEKAVGGMCSLIINLAVFLGGMFFPMETMNNAFTIICDILPFAPGIKLPKMIISNSTAGIWLPIMTLVLYMLMIFSVSIVVFQIKSKSDKKN